MKKSKPAKRPDVVLGDDWIAPHTTTDSEMRARRERRGLISINRSPLARKIVTFNLMALIILVAGVLYLNPFRDSLVFQRERGLVVEAELIADVFEAQLPKGEGGPTTLRGMINPVETLIGLDVPVGIEVFIFDNRIGAIRGPKYRGSAG